MNEQYKFSLKPLPYGYADLEPYVSGQTMKTHHMRHLGSYINSLNDKISKAPAYKGLSLTEIYAKADGEETESAVDMQYYSSAVYNHNLFFALLAPTYNDAIRSPVGSLGDALKKEFGSAERFMISFRDAAMALRGSGWVFLCKNKNDRPVILTCADHSRPSPDSFLPIILLDCWEHAYYLDHLDRKKEFFENFFRIINWQLAEMFWNLKISYR